VPKADIVAAGYDLNVNRYKEVVDEAVEHRDPREILKDLAAIEDDIRHSLADLEAML
jgi:type I restriction enzyme M protein